MIGFPEWIGRGVFALAMAVCMAGATHAAPRDPLDVQALQAEVAKESAQPKARQLPRTAFLASSELVGAWLSPDGRRVAWLREEGRNRALWVAPMQGGKPVRLLPNTDATSLAWSRDARWVFLESPRQVFALAMAGQGGSRAIAKLGGRWPRELLGADPALPAAVLLLESPPIVSRLPKRWRIWRIDAQGRETLVREDAKQLVDVAVDARGRLAFFTRVENAHYAVYRMRGNTPVRAMRCVDLERCGLLAASADGREATLLTDVGANHRRLARLNADDTLTTLHADPRGEADLQDVAFDARTQQPMVAGYRSTVAANYGLTPDAQRHVARIEARWPDRNLRIEVGTTQWLVHERATTMKGERLHAYDPATGAFRDVLVDVGTRWRGKPAPALDPAALSRKIPFAYRATDGMTIHGYVLVPHGVDPARAPIVAHVHGGPFSRFGPEFSSVSQMLANRGYVVFEPNFRGSTGFGRAYMRAGKGDFGNGRVQQDIVDGVRFLAAQGIGDANKAGIVGASFGGYSTLIGLTFQPDLFRVGVAAVPPADFGWVLRWYSQSVDQMATGIPMSTSMRLLDLDPADPAVLERLRAQSPIGNAEKMTRPLLLLAGADDERVPIRSVLHYAAALQVRNKDVTLLVDPDARHSVSDPRTREAYLYLIERLLHRRLGGAAPEAPSAGLKATLGKDLLLRGSDFRD
ncbi:prolyl oligopeptidase family serine peptidase [Lysobacter sp. A6]|uniref:Prolyl oligopeptidase family serine peptidase n=1 Tax=Noviluteimonas lactosilytica TaxID=2888523 RepID=A0ABS8JER1_9GAMM|nr:prolyl oligopeptidase family serine peptidase [Lysobacter lactosilyticus]MCC8362091.1 prolyl oligopeptidase family serine peptidase [Lysobacter lactosilyticus]